MSGKGRAHRRPDAGVVGLLVEILGGSADLRGAACTAEPRLYDPDVSAQALGYESDEEREAAIAATCISCPVRGACWAWASEQSANRIAGPTAASYSVGLVMRSRKPGRPRPTVAALQAPSTPEPATEDPEPMPARPRPSGRRGARSRVRPSIHRNTRHRRTR